jgi:broad specificity phosphatase PhoE
MREEDEEWSPTDRETMNHMARRIGSFFHWLVQCPQSNIVVVSHGVWIEVCFHMCCPEALDNGNRRVYNCNMFSSECVSVNGKFVRLQNVRQIK